MASGAFAQQQPAAANAEEPAVFRAGVALVRVDAQVVDGKRPLTGLTKDDFRIFDEGVPQQVEYFGRDSEPLSLVLLLDVSGSMKRQLEEITTVARRAMRVLGPADRVAVLFFGREVKVAQEFTQDFDLAAGVIATALREKGVGAGTAINGAVISAAKMAGEKLMNRPGRRALVILTDNEGLNYRETDEMTLAALFGADLVLNAIVTAKTKPPEAWRKGYSNPDFTPSDVFKLARETGGEVLRASKADESFQEMLERIRVRYSLHYRAPEGAAGSTRKLTVELAAEARKRNPKAEVRARSGYLAR